MEVQGCIASLLGSNPNSSAVPLFSLRPHGEKLMEMLCVCCSSKVSQWGRGHSQTTSSEHPCEDPWPSWTSHAVGSFQWHTCYLVHRGRFCLMCCAWHCSVAIAQLTQKDPRETVYSELHKVSWPMKFLLMCGFLFMGCGLLKVARAFYPAILCLCSCIVWLGKFPILMHLVQKLLPAPVIPSWI